MPSQHILLCGRQGSFIRDDYDYVWLALLGFNSRHGMPNEQVRPWPRGDYNSNG